MSFKAIALVAFSTFSGGSVAGQKYPFLYELAVVFKKQVSEQRAEAILTQLNYPHRPGSDSSRGKKYFYRTGPKYLMHVPKDEIGAVKAKLEAMSEIHEVYFPDWNIQKD